MDPEEPQSPETKAFVDSYTPSKESKEAQEFFGRRRLRIMNGQDPELMPHKFTPIVSYHYEWPTNKEAYAWAEAAARNTRKRQLFEKHIFEKKLKTPGGAAGGSCSTTPATDENLQPQQAAPPPAPVPFSMSCQ